MSGRAGLASAARDLPDLILLDRHLPDISGDEVLSQLKAEPATAGISVVIVSADASRSAIHRLLDGGALAYLTKPIELAQLGELLNTFAATQGHDRQAQPLSGSCEHERPRWGGRFPRPVKGGVMTHALLYIEDEEDNIALMRAVLRRRPQIELHVALNGRDGVQAAIDTRPGLILLDNRLPDTTGRDVLRELTSAAATAAIPVVVLSSDSGEVIDNLLENGAIETVAKPFDIHQFIAMIDRYLP